MNIEEMIKEKKLEILELKLKKAKETYEFGLLYLLSFKFIEAYNQFEKAIELDHNNIEYLSQRDKIIAEYKAIGIDLKPIN